MSAEKPFTNTDFVYVIEGTSAGKSVARKLSEVEKPGAIILLTSEEMDAVRNMITIRAKLPRKDLAAKNSTKLD